MILRAIVHRRFKVDSFEARIDGGQQLYAQLNRVVGPRCAVTRERPGNPIEQRHPEPASHGPTLATIDGYRLRAGDRCETGHRIKIVFVTAIAIVLKANCHALAGAMVIDCKPLTGKADSVMFIFDRVAAQRGRIGTASRVFYQPVSGKARLPKSVGDERNDRPCSRGSADSDSGRMSVWGNI